MLWAAIVALLRDKANASEILVSLMLVYVAEMVLSYLVYGPWKDPQGYNFPQTINFLTVTQVPKLFNGSRVNIGLVDRAGFGGPLLVVPVPQLFGLPAAGRRPGAGRGAATPASPHARPCGQHRNCCSRAAWPGWPVHSKRPQAAGPAHAARAGGLRLRRHHRGLRRGELHPVGIVFSSILMSMFYIGGELAQSRLGLPKSLTGVIPGAVAVLAAGLRHADPLPHCRTCRGAGWVLAPASAPRP